MTEYKPFRIERKAGHLAEVVLTGPGHGNAVRPDFWREFPGRVVEC